MRRNILMALIVGVLSLGLMAGTIGAVSACHLCWTERTIDITVKDALGVTPEENIQVTAYRGCCTEVLYTVTNLTDEVTPVYIEKVGSAPAGIYVTLIGGSPVTLEAGESKDLTIRICADCSAQSGSVTFRFASGACIQPLAEDCPTCPQ